MKTLIFVASLLLVGCQSIYDIGCNNAYREHIADENERLINQGAYINESRLTLESKGVADKLAAQCGVYVSGDECLERHIIAHNAAITRLERDVAWFNKHCAAAKWTDGSAQIIQSLSVTSTEQ